MKKKVLAIAFGLAILFSGSAIFKTQEAEAVVAISFMGGDKGDLYGNSSGTKYCCKASDYKDCGASPCGGAAIAL